MFNLHNVTNLHTLADPAGPDPPCPKDLFRQKGKILILSSAPTGVKTPLAPPDQNPGSAPGTKAETVLLEGISRKRGFDESGDHCFWKKEVHSSTRKKMADENIRIKRGQFYLETQVTHPSAATCSRCETLSKK